MRTAGLGDLDIVKRLVQAGADVNRSAWADQGEIEWTASAYASKAGHDDVAQWLTSQMSEETLAKLEALRASRDPRFISLYDNGTAGETASTDDIAGTLGRWDDRYGVSLVDATSDSVTLKFATLPDDLEALRREILTLCPDAEDDPDLVSTLAKKKSLFLCWD